jgi:hypothetical protein
MTIAHRTDYPANRGKTSTCSLMSNANATRKTFRLVEKSLRECGECGLETDEVAH